MKTTKYEIRTILDGINSVVEIAEEEINKHKDIEIVTIQNETHRERIIL